MAGNETDQPSGQAISTPQSFRPSVRSCVTQLTVATVWFIVGAFLSSELLRGDPYTIAHRSLTVATIGLAFLVAFVHLMLFIWATRLRFKP